MRLLLTLLTATVLTVTACGDSGAAGGCVEVREPEDPLSIQHVLDPESVTFRTDPPTSGPHLSGPPVRGVLDAPVTPAAQVRVLEEGGVMVQATSDDHLASLAPLADAGDVPIVVAPADGLPAPVVATAWTWKLTCETPDLDRLRTFAATRADDAPGLD